MTDNDDGGDARLERYQRRLGRTVGDPRLPRVGDGITRRVNMVEAYCELVAVSLARVEFLGELLALQMERDAVVPDPDNDAYGITGRGAYPGPVGAGGLVGYVLTTNVVGPVAEQRVELTPTAEEPRALYEMERQERILCAKLIKDAAAMQVDLQQIEVIRTYAPTLRAALTSVLAETGLSLSDEPVLRAAQRAALVARREMGQDDGDPDLHVGPAMSPVERVEMLRAALERAESAAQASGVLQ